MVKNRKCLSCSTKFSYCPDCSRKDALKPSWASEFCCEDCKTIWTTATKYNLNKMTKAEAKSIISALALKPIEQYTECVQKDLANILAEDPKPKRTKKAEPKISEPVAANTVEEEIAPTEEPIPAEAVTSVEETIPVTEEIHEVIIKTEE